MTKETCKKLEGALEKNAAGDRATRDVGFPCGSAKASLGGNVQADT